MKNNVMLYLLMMSCLCCNSCEEEGIGYTSELLAPYVQEFESEAAKYGHPVDLSGYSFILDDLNGHRGAHMDGSKKLVIVDFAFYELFSDDDWMMLVAISHELGHGLLGRDHDNTESPQRYALSIMHEEASILMDGRKEDRDALMKELFTQTKSITP